MKKLTISLFAAFVFCFAFCLAAGEAYGANILHEQKTQETLSRGVVYERNRMMTGAGLMDVYTLRVPLNDPFISLGVAESKKEHGLKEATSTLLKENNAIAGTNADFFGMAGRYSASFGPVITGGVLRSLSTAHNKEEDEFASLLIPGNGSPLIKFLKTEVRFINDGKQNITIHAINKVTDMVMPIIVTSDAMRDTAALDARFPGLLKVVVKDKQITYVSEQGQSVQIPENGYALVIQQASAGYFRQFFDVGQHAVLEINATGVDLSQIETAIGGGGVILRNGEPVSEGTIITGRHPRTAVGINQDKTQLIIMEVDGRSHSVGATHDEMGILMKRYGAYDAMHLDGGGSSTMVVQKPGGGAHRVVNTTSDGGERRVINAFGVFNGAPPGEPEKLMVEPEAVGGFLNVPLNVDVFAVDDYYRRAETDDYFMEVTTDDTEGEWLNTWYMPGRPGVINFTATYRNLTETRAIEFVDLQEIRPSMTSMALMQGEKINLYFTGIGGKGSQAAIISGIAYEIYPHDLGYMDGNAFVADKPGHGYIKCVAGGIPAYIAVYSGGREVPAYSFDGSREIRFVSYPEIVTGGVSYSPEQHSVGTQSARLSYSFTSENVTQAAYMEFAQPVEFEGEPFAVKLAVYGDESDLWLRGRVLDAEDNEFTVDFVRNMDWRGWKQVFARIPSGVKYPVRLDRVYLASADNIGEISGSVYIDNLCAVYRLLGEVILPEAPKFKDPLKTDLAKAEATMPSTAFDITAVGKTVWDAGGQNPGDYDGVRARVLEEILRKSSRALYIGKTGYSTEGRKVYEWNPGYIMHREGNVAILQMSAEKGGLFATNPEQWSRFTKDLDAAEPSHIIVELDVNPHNFAQPQEYELLHGALKQYQQKGISVFVVSTDGGMTTDSVREGIRYINLGGLWKDDGSYNENFMILRLRVDGKDVQYQLTQVR